MRLFLTVVAGASILTACGIANRIDAQQNYKQSVANYRNCLAANPSNVNACESQRLIMQTDERAFGQMDDALRGGSTNTFIALGNLPPRR